MTYDPSTIDQTGLDPDELNEIYLEENQIKREEEK